MMKHKGFLTGIFGKAIVIALLVFGLVLAGCSDDGGGAAEPKQAAFKTLTADGSATARTTKLTLTFDKDIAGLSATDITLTPDSAGITKGALTAKGSGVYKLAVSGITTGGQITVSVTKSGCVITPASKDVTVYYYQHTDIFDDVDMVAPSLDALGGDNTAGSPYTLVFEGINLEEKLAAIMTAVATSGKYVNLDFAECSATNDLLIQIGTAVKANANIKGISIPDGVTSIGDEAFKECSSLTSITIPDGVTSIGMTAFLYCSSLTSITIPDGVTSIGDGAFASCSSLTSITIPDGVTSRGRGAFANCSSLTSITIPDSVISIGEYAFASCSLTSITIPDGVTSIEDGVFQACTDLTSITIPDSVTSIGGGAFQECTRLTSITMLPSTPPTLGVGVFYNISPLPAIKVPSANLAAYTTGNTVSGWTADIKAKVAAQ